MTADVSDFDFPVIIKDGHQTCDCCTKIRPVAEFCETCTGTGWSDQDPGHYAICIDCCICMEQDE